ncbi:MAG: 50S ribosomal protein L11 [Rhodospirillales bacterium]
MAKKIKGYVKLQVPAGQANPAPPIGPALGQAGLNIMAFCEAFNTETKKMKPGVPIPVIVTAYQDRSFSFVTKTPPASYFLKEAAGLDKAAEEPGKEIVGQVTRRQVREIAEKKLVDLNSNDMDAACRMIIGSARSMGIEVVD